MRYTEEAIATIKGAESVYSDIAHLKDPNLSQEGLAARRTALKATLHEDLRVKATELRTRAEAVRDTRRMVANAARPHIQNDPAALIRSQQKWEQAKMLLDAGRSLQEVVRTADLDTVLAIEEWAPSYIAAQSAKPSGFEGLGFDGAPVDISSTINRRLVDLVPADVAATLQEAADAEADYAQAAPYIQLAESMANGTAGPQDRIGAAIDSTFAAQTV